VNLSSEYFNGKARMYVRKPIAFPVRTLSVKKVSEYHLYELAIAIHPLTEVANQIKYSEIWLPWFNARAALENLFQQRQLEFCYESGNKLYLAINAVVPKEWMDGLGKISTLGDPEPDLGFTERYNVVESAKEFETVLRTELNNADTYFVDPKGTHKTSVLLTQASREIPSHLLADIPEITDDINQAGRCLLFDNSTAVGFHLMRAVETVIYRYLKKLTGNERPVKSRNWGVYIGVFKKLNADPKVIGTIQHIKDVYRNPILHPEVTLTPDEAQVLFGLSVSAIVQIAGAMKASQGAVFDFPVSGAIAVT
jgi:hypothetical protein